MIRMFATGLGLCGASALAGLVIFSSHEALASGPRLAPSVTSGMAHRAAALLSHQQPTDDAGKARAADAPAPADRPVAIVAQPTCTAPDDLRVLVIRRDEAPAPRIVATSGFAPDRALRPRNRPGALAVTEAVAEPATPRVMAVMGDRPRLVTVANRVPPAAAPNPRAERNPRYLWNPLVQGYYR